MAVKLVIQDEVNIKFVNLPLEARKKLANTFKYDLPHARYHPAYKLGRWDGTISMFGIGGNGYLSQLETILNVLDKMNIEIDEIEDLRDDVKLNFNTVTETYWADRGKTWPPGHPNAGESIMLRDYQVSAINTFLENLQSIQVIATGAGKSILAATMAHLCEPFGRTVTIVPSKSLVEQTVEDYLLCGLDAGVYYGDKKELNKTHTLCTWQSLSVLDKKTKNGEADLVTLAEFLDGVRAVIVDEVHSSKAAELQKLLTQNLAKSPIRWGLTGTMPKEKYETDSILSAIGPVVGGIKAHELQEAGILSNCRVNIHQMIDLPVFKTYAEELKYLVTDKDRVRYISGVIKEIAKTGNTLVLINRIDTGKLLTEQLENAVFVSGEVKSKDRKEEYDDVKIQDDKIIVATYGVAAVGINILRVFNLVLLEPGKSFVRVIQSIGRGLRKGLDKDHVEIYDITSTCKYAKRHLTERKRFYKEAKYAYTVQKVDWKA